MTTSPTQSNASPGKPPATTGELTILSIARNSDGPKPLHVCFRLDQRDPATGDYIEGGPREADFSASEVETFAAFRRSVANRLGIWPSHCSEQQGRTGRENWNLEIRYAFEKGANT